MVKVLVISPEHRCYLVRDPNKWRYTGTRQRRVKCLTQTPDGNIHVYAGVWARLRFARQ